MPKRVKVRIVVDGRTKWVTGSTQQEVILAAAKILAECDAAIGTRTDRKQAPLFSVCAWNWFNAYKLPKVRGNTAYNYWRNMENHVLPAFGNRCIAEITPTDIQEYLNTKRDKAKSTVHHIWLILHGSLPHITLYGLRHTAASVMNAQGMSAKEVANQLGHAQASTTLDIYAHAFEDANARAAQVVATAYDFAREQLQQA